MRDGVGPDPQPLCQDAGRRRRRGRPVAIVLAVRRFFCAAPGCPRKTFAEQVDGLTTRYARKTPLLAGMLGSIAVALAGRAGSRLAAGLGVPASRQVLLRLVMAAPDPQAASPRVLGVDDFAIRRGQHYGTLLIDIETGAPLDLLEGRDARPLADWLAAVELTGVADGEPHGDDEITRGFVLDSLASSWALLGQYSGNYEAVQRWWPQRAEGRRSAVEERRTVIESALGPAIGITRTFDLGEWQLDVAWAIDKRVDDALTQGDVGAVLAAQKAFAERLAVTDALSQPDDSEPETTADLPEADNQVVPGEPLESRMSDGSIFSVTVR